MTIKEAKDLLIREQEEIEQFGISDISEEWVEALTYAVQALEHCMNAEIVLPIQKGRNQ